MSVNGVYSTFSRLQSDHIRVQQDRCVMVRNRNAACSKCSDVCTTGCISMQDGVLHVLQEKCIGCGTCATACPTGALEARLPSDAALLSKCLAASAGAGKVVIACSRLVEKTYGTFDPARVVEVACLGRIDESLLAALVERGVDEVLLCGHMCETCAHVEGRYVCEQVCAAVSDLLEAWGRPALIKVAEGMPREVGAAGAVAFAQPEVCMQVEGPLGAGDAESAQPGPEECGEEPEPRYRPMHVMEDGTLPHFVPDRRERLLDSLAAMGEPGQGVLNVRLWGHVQIDTERCSSCRACAIFCPTGAIRKFGEPDDEVFGIEHYPGDCVKCLCCENVCPRDALKVLDEVDASWISSGTVERVQMPPVRVRKGCSQSILNSIRALSGMDEIYER